MEGMRIHYCLADQEGPGFFRCMLPGEYLKTLGHTVTYSMSVPSVPEAREHLDVVVVQRLCHPEAARWLHDLVAARACATVLEMDDDLWNIDRSNKASVTFFDQGKLDVLAGVARAVDLITTSTAPLGQTVGQFNDNVAVLPNSIPEELIVHPTATETNTMGWAGSNTHTRDFGEAAKPIQRFLMANKDWHFRTISPVPDYSHRIASLAKIADRVHYTPWVQGVPNYLRQLSFAIGLAPLYPSQFNDAKSDLKVLELAGLGIPTIASNTGPYARAIESGCPALGMETNSHKQWLDAMNDVARDEKLRTELGHRGREWAKTRTISVTGQLWESAYASIASALVNP